MTEDSRDIDKSSKQRSLDRALDSDRRFAKQSMRQNFALYLASMLCPGVVWATKGYIARSLIINAGFVLAWMLYFALWMMWKFYPVGPTVWFVLWWLLLLYLNARDAARAPLRRDVPMSSMTNSVFSMLTWFAPMALLMTFAATQIATVVTIQSGSMFPTAVPGDLLWVDRSIYRRQWPTRGDVVVYRGAEDGRVYMGRVVGLPSDLISFEDGTLVDSGASVGYMPIDEPFASQFARSTGYPPEYVHAQYEVLDTVVYPVSGLGASDSGHDFDGHEWKVGDGELFVLNDNRGHVDDSRVFGPIEYDQLIGMPLYVLWSGTSDKRLRKTRTGGVMQYPRHGNGRANATEHDDVDELLEELKDD